MAEHHMAQGGHPAMDYAAHERTYALFVSLAKYGTMVAIAIVAGMAIFLL
jgi:hypothetical protein